MAKFLVELWLDGYDSEKDMEAACEEFIYEQLNFSGSGVTVTKVEEDGEHKTSDSDPKRS